MKKRFPKSVEARSVRILSELSDGTHWSQIRGYAYRLPAAGTIVVYRLPAWHRLVCWLEDGFPCRSQVMSHERYNSLAANIRR